MVRCATGDSVWEGGELSWLLGVTRDLSESRQNTTKNLWTYKKQITIVLYPGQNVNPFEQKNLDSGFGNPSWFLFFQYCLFTYLQMYVWLNLWTQNSDKCEKSDTCVLKRSEIHPEWGQNEAVFNMAQPPSAESVMDRPYNREFTRGLSATSKCQRSR